MQTTTDTLQNVLDANRCAQAADDAWTAALRQRHGKDAGDARYRDQETPELDDLKTAFIEAVLAMCNANDAHRAAVARAEGR